MIVDANEYTIDAKLKNMLEAKGVGLVNFSHKRCGGVPLNTYIDGKYPIYAGYRSPDVKATNSCMSPFSKKPWQS